MAIGVPVSKAQFDDFFGSTVLMGKLFFERVTIAKEFLDQYSSAQLQTAGFVATAADGDVVKSSYEDLAQLEAIWRGAANLGVAKDFRTFVRRIWGLGVRATNV